MLLIESETEMLIPVVDVSKRFCGSGESPLPGVVRCEC